MSFSFIIQSLLEGGGDGSSSCEEGVVEVVTALKFK